MISTTQTKIDAVVWASYRKTGISAKTYLLLIDLDNEGGEYRHDGEGLALQLTGIAGSFYKSAIADQWVCRCGVVLAVSATDATVAWLARGLNVMRDPGTPTADYALEIVPGRVCLEVSGGALAKISSNYVETTPDLDTGAKKAEDIGGVARNVAPGDLICRVELPTGSVTGDLEMNYLLGYYAE